MGAFLVGIGVVRLSYGVSDEARPSSSFDLGFDPTDPNEDLMQPGRRVTLEEASLAAGLNLIRPQHPLASDASLSEVWLGEAGALEIGLRYASGLRAYITVVPADKDPGSSYARIAAELGAGRTLTINGSPAFVASADEQAPGYPPNAVVDLSIGRLEISLHADVPLDTLIAIAGTVSAQPIAQAA